MSGPPLPGLVADALQQIAPIVEQEPMARDTYRMRLHCPEVAAGILPGQFFMLRVPGRSDPLLGRPFALYDVYCDADGAPAGVDFGYVVVGKMTRLFSTLPPGSELELWGPLGNGFPPPPAGRLLIVAGGIGQTPFLAVVREALGLSRYGRPQRAVPARPSGITMCYGVRSADFLAGVDDFDLPGLDLRLATDDGTAGHAGFVTDLLRAALDEDERPELIYCCGPEPLMHAVQEIAAARAVPCLLSLESPMACGFGACFSCVTRVQTEDGGWDYRRVCVEGPVFPAERVIL